MYLITYYQINLFTSNLYNTFANVNKKQIKYFTNYEQKTNRGFNRTRNNSD